VSHIRADRSARGKVASVSDRTRGIATQAIPQAKQAGTTAVHGVMQGVEGARGWAAPRVEGARVWAAPHLENAADAITATVAPKVSSALRSTASAVQPSRPRRTGMRRLLDWRLLLGIGAAVAAASAAAAVTMRKRYESATAAAKDAADMDAADMAPGTTPAGRTPAGRTDAPGGPTAAADETATPGVNGRATTPHH
jgi:hypothetical protein